MIKALPAYTQDYESKCKILEESLDYAGEQLRDLCTQVANFADDQEHEFSDAPYSAVTSPVLWAVRGQERIQEGLMMLRRAVAAPHTF